VKKWFGRYFLDGAGHASSKGSPKHNIKKSSQGKEDQGKRGEAAFSKKKTGEQRDFRWSKGGGETPWARKQGEETTAWIHQKMNSTTTEEE